MHYDVFDHLVGRVEFLGNSTTPAQTQQFVWDGWNIALILDAAGAVAERRFNGDAADQMFASEDGLNEVTWLLTDHLSTPRDFIDSAGALLNHRVTNSFGLITSETDSSVGQNISFTGGYFDSVTGLVYRWHRWYSPHTHRWLSEDWIEDDLQNTYRYVGNKAISRRDVAGLADELSENEIIEGVIRNLERLIEEERRQTAKLLAEGEAESERARDELFRKCGDSEFTLSFIFKDTVWEAAMKSIADTEDARNEAQRIARSLENTIRKNWKSDQKYSETDERFQGYFCWDWAYALEDAVRSESSGKYFDVSVQSAVVESDEGVTFFGARVHFWIRVINKETGKAVYFDDSFCNGRFAHYDRPIPKGYSANNGPVTDIPRSSSRPPPSYNADGTPTRK